MVGYPLVLPDMIGGNAYFGQYPDAELMKRWCQVSAYLPMMQFSLKPWQRKFSEKVEEVCRNAAIKHLQLLKEFLMKHYLEHLPLQPIVEPLFFKFPEDKKSYDIDDQFIAFDKYLVAPILTDSGKRDIYLPPGKWKEIHTGESFSGPILLKDFATEDYIPVFTQSD